MTFINKKNILLCQFVTKSVLEQIVQRAFLKQVVLFRETQIYRIGMVNCLFVKRQTNKQKIELPYNQSYKPYLCRNSV